MKRFSKVKREHVGIACLVFGALLMLCLVIVSLPGPAATDRYVSTHPAVTPGPLMILSPDSLLNTGDVKALDALPGIGEVLAERIIQVREELGGYQLPEELMLVKGIGEKKFTDVMDALDEPMTTMTDLH